MSYTHQMTPLPAQYDTAAIEKKWQQFWLNNKTYAWNPDVAREDSYVIDTPPPTVSGTLHMGHVFSYTQADFVARFQRMNGKNVFYPMGFDDNGLPTERLVEKTKKIRAADMSREDFIAQCMEVSEEARKEFRHLFESIALSVDWDQEYHTISESSRRLSQLSFLDLVNKGHAYRALKPFYWDPVDQTAIAQAEIVDKEIASFQNILLFTIGGAPAPVMTTRPELLPACVALMYHPDDAAKYRGKKALTPLFNIEVPMIADEKVDREKGTGLVMCCTFGDDTDKEWWEKHKLNTRVILNKYGKLDPALLKAAGIASALIEKIQNKKVSNPDPKNPGARETIIALLKEANLLTEQKPITHAVKCAERSGAPLEILPSEQWFIRVTDKKAALTARTKECGWNPDWMRLRMEQWIDGLNQDWCISRQRYFGVPFPVWYEVEEKTREKKVIYATADELPINPLSGVPQKYKNGEYSIEDGVDFGYMNHPDPAKKRETPYWIVTHNKTGVTYEIVPDADVMDTWATSSISPQLSAGAISKTDETKGRFAKLFPADLRPQAHEIIRTWAFYTLVKAHLHNNQIPWKNLMISGWCLAEDKSKMSKSKGNVITPVALIEEKGTDAVRYWAATSRLGQDTAFSPDLLKIGKKLVGKLWNATQFTAMHLAKLQEEPTTAATAMESGRVSELLDRWILSKLAITVHSATEAFHRYEYADALDATNQFFWADFCDNYLELIKKRIYTEEGTAQQSAIVTLYHCLDGILKLYAPFVPHVTEELYSHIFVGRGSLHARGQWPLAAHYTHDSAALTAGAQALELLNAIRKAKSESNRSIKFPIDVLTVPSRFTEPERWMADVSGAGNVKKWQGGDTDTLAIQFAAEADTADH